MSRLQGECVPDRPGNQNGPQRQGHLDPQDTAGQQEVQEEHDPMDDYVVVTPLGLDGGERVRVAYQKSYLVCAEPVERTIARQRAGLNNDIKFAKNGQFAAERPKELRDAKMVQAADVGHAGDEADGMEEGGVTEKKPTTIKEEISQEALFNPNMLVKPMHSTVHMLSAIKAAITFPISQHVPFLHTNEYDEQNSWSFNIGIRIYLSHND